MIQFYGVRACLHLVNVINTKHEPINVATVGRSRSIFQPRYRSISTSWTFYDRHGATSAALQATFTLTPMTSHEPGECFVNTIDYAVVTRANPRRGGVLCRAVVNLAKSLSFVLTNGMKRTWDREGFTYNIASMLSQQNATNVGVGYVINDEWHACDNVSRYLGRKLFENHKFDIRSASS